MSILKKVGLLLFCVTLLCAVFVVCDKEDSPNIGNDVTTAETTDGNQSATNPPSYNERLAYLVNSYGTIKYRGLNHSGRQ